MAKKLNDTVAEAERLFVEAALLMTRLRKPMKRACRLVLVHGCSVLEAAKRIGQPERRNNVYRALAKVKKALEQVKAAP